MTNTNEQLAQASLATIGRIAYFEAVRINGGFRYDAILTNGERVTVRKKATRLYDKAFSYAKPPGSSGKEIHALHNYFTFGRSPIAPRLQKYYPHTHTFAILSA